MRLMITTKWLEKNGWERIDDVTYEKGNLLCVYADIDEDWIVYKKVTVVDNIEDLKKISEC